MLRAVRERWKEDEVAVRIPTRPFPSCHLLSSKLVVLLRSTTPHRTHRHPAPNDLLSPLPPRFAQPPLRFTHSTTLPGRRACYEGVDRAATGDSALIRRVKNADDGKSHFSLVPPTSSIPPYSPHGRAPPAVAAVVAPVSSPRASKVRLWATNPRQKRAERGGKEEEGERTAASPLPRCTPSPLRTRARPTLPHRERSPPRALHRQARRPPETASSERVRARCR